MNPEIEPTLGPLSRLFAAIWYGLKAMNPAPRISSGCGPLVSLADSIPKRSGSKSWNTDIGRRNLTTVSGGRLR